MLSKKLKGMPGQFQDSNFTATKWNTAEDKVRMANKLTKFILNGFQQSSFTKDMYKRLSTMFGHIAEYDIHGFYSVWFEDDAACLKWAENAMRGGVLGFVVGDPVWTWSDIEKVLIQWMKDNQITEQLDELYQHDIEQKVLALLNTLQRKHAPQQALPQVDEVTLVPVEMSTSQTADHQLSMF
jgi:hypothetical protein